MNSSKIKSCKSAKGFTLIELLIVIAIIGILAAALLVALNPGQRIAASRNARVRSDLVNLGSAANLFNVDSGLAANCPSGGSYPNNFGQTSALCKVKFVPQLLDPVGGNYAFFAFPSGCTSDTVGQGCTGVAISGPAYSDGTIITSAKPFWCWTSATGTVTQTVDSAELNVSDGVGHDCHAQP
jgi:prepilin-type N-terminal cleavage/methylation domain-containing protein